ncbi:CID domain-containing protein [Aphelenchoides bicaudatus]|nr:CID domain-containing protein [Aphelenchoides bicaudatus]
MSVSEHEIRTLLENVNVSTESIQSVSKWIIKNKFDIETITQVWFELYGRGSDELKIALIYVMNDAVQAAKHYKDTTIPIAFHPFVVNAATFASETVKKPIKRCLDVFSQRDVYPEHVINEMRAALDGSLETTQNGEDAADVDIEKFRGRLEHYRDACNSIDQARQILGSINFEYECDDPRIKSKQGVIEMEDESEQMIEKLQKFIDSIEGQYKRTLKVKQLNQRVIKQYETQLKDVAVVQDAYDRFAKGIEASRSFLETIQQTGVLPGQTPPFAPSPTASEERSENGDDMEIDDEDQPTTSNGESGLISPQDYIPFPVFNNPPNVYQPTTVTNNTAVSKADPRKMRNAPPPESPIPISPQPWTPQSPVPFQSNIPPPGYPSLPTPEPISPMQPSGFFQHQQQMRPRGGMMPRGNHRFFSPRDSRPQFVGNRPWNNQNFRGNFQHNSPSNRRRSDEFPPNNDWHASKKVRRGNSTHYE